MHKYVNGHEYYRRHAQNPAQKILSHNLLLETLINEGPNDALGRRRTHCPDRIRCGYPVRIIGLAATLVGALTNNWVLVARLAHVPDVRKSRGCGNQ